MTTVDKIILPEKYYLDYFRYVLHHVQIVYPQVLGEQASFIAAFEALSEPAKCLYLRMNIRRGRYFRISKFHYSEIPDIDLAKKELLACGFIRSLDASDPKEEVLQIFTKADIWQLIISSTSLPIKKSASKEELLNTMLSIYDDEVIQKFDPVVVQERIEDVAIIKLLFFGHPYGDLSEFVARDVGHIRLQNMDNASFTPIFKNRDEVEAHWKMYLLYQEWKTFQDADISKEMLTIWLDANETFFKTWANGTGRVSEKLCLAIGKAVEKLGMLEKAVEVYSLIDSPDAQKRQLMLLRKLGWEDAALALAQQLAENGKNVNVRLYGQDFIDKQQKSRVSSTTARLKKAALIEVVFEPGKSIEQEVLLHFKKMGYDGFFSENYVWRSIFGLVFWEEITSLEYNAYHHPLQRLPSDMFDGFMVRREDAINKKWLMLASKEAFKRHLINNFQKYLGHANPFVHWHPELLTSIEAFVHWLSLDQLQAVLMAMAANPKENATGFPDLFVYNNDGYYFYEVKSPNDHLSPQQWFWLDFFQKKGITIDILRTL